MFLRALAVLAAIAVPLLLTIDAISGLHPAMFWVGPLVAIACALPIVLAAESARGQALVGAGLAAMAAASSPELPELLAVTRDPDAMPVLDLREAPVPEGQDGYVAVRGYLRTEWVVDEYQVADGDRPDQNEEAKAVLLPLLGTNEEIIAADEHLGRVIVARVSPRVAYGSPLVTLRGRLVPVGPEIVDSLFIVQVNDQGLASGVELRPKAVMLDTLDMPTRGQALTRTGLAGGAALLSLILLLLALPRPAARAKAKPEGDVAAA
ncbi:hypothetical protein ENSA5_51640 [Enhygromyxa salina]|uniref:Uncharacterized protein n=1 Tax=Enhygromyxa salina TaxID=215803 RepID=A0A2S9XH49_9BACT|nr:hypothetical protein [Enhygromyxa salina]PRP92070.1 hypothetical protein ENSA5_51640 [Enhygromyxa salina]